MWWLKLSLQRVLLMQHQEPLIQLIKGNEHVELHGSTYTYAHGPSMPLNTILYSTCVNNVLNNNTIRPMYFFPVQYTQVCQHSFHLTHAIDMTIHTNKNHKN
jgi:hypothetical protein